MKQLSTKTLDILSCLCILLTVPLATQAYDCSVTGEDVPHNCRMYGAISDDLPDGLLYDHLVDDLDSLLNLSYSNIDGWGIIYYPNYGDSPTMERGAIRAWNDANYSTVVTAINTSEPKVVLGHIRNCVSGCCDHGGDSIPNPHPFYRTKNGKTWTFEHNGVIDKDPLRGFIGDTYLYANAPFGSDVASCYTEDPYDDSTVVDSELYFLFLLKSIEDNNWNANKGITEALSTIIANGETGSINFLMSDGMRIWAFRRGTDTHTLYYTYNQAQGYAATASQPPSGTSDPNWIEMTSQQLVVLTSDNEPVIINDVRNYVEELLVDSDFNGSVDSADLIADANGQDWYESRNDEPNLLTLDETDIAGNDGKKAKLSSSDSVNAYLTQEFSQPQNGSFTVTCDIYVDEILDIESSPDRAAWMLIGDDTDPCRTGPNSDDSERFAYMAFYKSGGGTTGTMDLVVRDRDDSWDGFTTVVSDLELDQWHSIKVVCDLNTDTYEIYLNGDYQATVTSRNVKGTVTHISFAQWNDGAGTYYVDNVTATPWTTTTSSLFMVDSKFNDSDDSADLRANSIDQGWYESRNDNPSLLTLDLSNVGGNPTKKASLKGWGTSTNAYLTQDFGSQQTSAFDISFNIYIDKIENSTTYDRTGHIYIGDASDGQNGPCSTSSERFVMMAFYDSTPGYTGPDLELRAREPGQSYSDTSTWTLIASDLGYDMWHLIKIYVDVAMGTYDVYINGILEGDGISKYDSPTLSSISFAADSDGRGEFYVDDVTSPAYDTDNCSAANLDKLDCVNLKDLAILINDWAATEWDCIGDIDKSRLVDFGDVDYLTQHWLDDCNE